MATLILSRRGSYFGAPRLKTNIDALSGGRTGAASLTVTISCRVSHKGGQYRCVGGMA